MNVSGKELLTVEDIAEHGLIQNDNISIMRWLDKYGYCDVRLQCFDPDWKYTEDPYTYLNVPGYQLGKSYADKTDYELTVDDQNEIITGMHLTDPGHIMLMKYLIVHAVCSKNIMCDGGVYAMSCDSTFKYEAMHILNSVFGRDHFLDEIIMYSDHRFNRAKIGFSRYDSILLYWRGKKKSVVFNKYLVLDKKSPKRREKDNPIYGGAFVYDIGKRKKNVDPDDFVLIVTDPELYQKSLEEGGGYFVLGEPYRKTWGGVLYNMKINPNTCKGVRYNSAGDPTSDYYMRPVGPVWNIQPVQSKKEKTSKPQEMYRRLISIFTNEGDIVMDSTAGWGNGGVEADKLKRKWILIEKNPDRVRDIMKKLKKNDIDVTYAGEINTETQRIERLSNVVTKDVINRLNSLLGIEGKHDECVREIVRLFGGKYTHGPNDRGQDIHYAGTTCMYVDSHKITKDSCSKVLSRWRLLRREYPDLQNFWWVSQEDSGMDESLRAYLQEEIKNHSKDGLKNITVMTIEELFQKGSNMEYIPQVNLDTEFK